MKNNLIILILAISFSSCFSHPNCDKQLYDCWIITYSNLGFDLKVETGNLEKELIKKTYLKDSSYNSYIEFLCNYSDSNINITGLREFPTINYSNTNKSCSCNDSCINTENSFFSFTKNYLKNAKSNNQNSLRECIDERKFINSPIYKTWILLNVYMKIQTKNQFAKFVTKLAQPNEQSKDFVGDTITMNSKGVIFLNNTQCSRKSIRDKTKGMKRLVLKTNEKMNAGQTLELSDTLKNMGIELIIK